MKPGDIVKYSQPQPGEEQFRFLLLDDTAEVGERVDIQLLSNDYRIAPIERVKISDIVPANDRP